MKKSIIALTMISAIALASCGSKKTEVKTNDNTSTNQTTENKTVDENKPLVKYFNYFAAKLNNFSLDGLTLTKDLVNDDLNNKDIRRSWTTDVNQSGFDKIWINGFSLTRTGNRKETENKTLDEFKTFQTKYADPTTKLSDFKEYKKDSLVFFYCTKKGCNESMGHKDYNQIQFSHFTGDVGINGSVVIWDKKMPIDKAEEAAIKAMDFLAQP